MHNFRHHQPKNSFGGRGAQQNSDMPNPWMTEEEVFNMRRQNPQFHSVMPNVGPNLQIPHLNQSHMLSAPNKNYINENSCKMIGSNFNRSPNPDIFKSLPPVNESNHQNNFMGDRFSGNNSFPDVNMQYKMSDRPIFNDFSGTPHPRFSENVPKPSYPNMRQPQEIFPCMQGDQNQLNFKYGKSQKFHVKGSPFSNDKSLHSPNSPQYFDKVPISAGSNFSSRPGYKAPSLFPAYSPKDGESGSKAVQHSAFSSDCIEKTNSCDKDQVSPSCSKSLQPFEEKSLQDRNLEKALDELFKIDASFKNSLKDSSNSQPAQDSFKSPVETTSSKSKFSFLPENQQPCFQSSNDIPFQTSQSMELSSHSNSSSKDCLMQTSQSMDLSNHPNPSSRDYIQPSQNVQTSNHVSSSFKDCLMQNSSLSVQQTGTRQNVKEPSSNCSFSFESGISAADIAELLPGIDAFLKETLNKSEEQFAKSDANKSDSAFSTSDSAWLKPTIPFIGDQQASYNSVLNVGAKDSFCDDAVHLKGRYTDKFESRSEKTSDTKSTDIHPKSSVGKNQQKDTSVVTESPKVRSALEEAVDMLVTNDAIVGLDYIIEFKKNISQKGSFPFKCKLCNSAIPRPSIIDHIIGSKHRMRYLKSKDESKYDYIISLKVEKSEKDAKISETARELEKIYGRGHVIVDTEESQKDTLVAVDSSTKVTVEQPPVDVFTLDNIPIGFEALSPEHDDVHSASFTLDSNLNQDNSCPSVPQEPKVVPAITAEVKKEVPDETSSPVGFTLPGLDLESCSSSGKSNSLLPTQPGIGADSLKDFEGKKDSGTELVPQSEQSPVHAPVKRSASSESLHHFKQQKLDETADAPKSGKDSVADDATAKIKPELSPAREKSFSSDLLEELSKCIISTEEDASFALQAVNVLIQMLMRYKLQHVSLEVLESLLL